MKNTFLHSYLQSAPLLVGQPVVESEQLQTMSLFNKQLIPKLFSHDISQ